MDDNQEVKVKMKNKLLLTIIALIAMVLLATTATATIDWTSDTSLFLPLYNDGTATGSYNAYGGVKGFGNYDNYALEFDGTNDYVNIGDWDSVMNYNVDWSFTTWFYVDPSSSDTAPTIFDGSDGGSGTIQFFLQDGNIKVTNNADSSADWWIQYTQSSKGEWHLFTVTWSSSGEIKAYVDGILKGSDTSGTLADFYPNNHKPLLGARNNGYDNVIDKFLQGKLSKTIIYNKALSDTEVQSLYNEGRNTPTSVATSDIVFSTALNEQSDYSGTRYGEKGYNGATWDDTEEAIVFDGTDDYVNVASGPFITNDEITISAWFKSSDVNSNTIFWEQNDNNVDGVFVTMQDTHKIRATISDGSNEATLYSTTEVNDGNWHHIAVRYKSGDSHLYLDGVEEDSSTDTYSGVMSENPTDIGRRHISTETTQYFNGKISNVNIWHKALSSTEISDLYNEGRTGLTNVARENIVFETTVQSQTQLDKGMIQAQALNGVEYDDTEDAYYFDGSDDYIEGPNILKYSSFSINTWIKTNNNFGTIYSEGISDGTPRILLLTLDDKIQFEIKDYDGDVNYIKGSVTITDNNWHLITATYDHTTKDMKLFIDNNLDSTTTYNQDDFSATGGLSRIGYDITDQYAYNGFINGFKIFNRALTDTEVQQLYNEGRNSNPYSTPSNPGNFSVTVLDEWDNNPVINITVTINGTTYTNETGNTITSTIKHNDTALYNITIEAPNYITANLYNINVTNDLTTTLWQNNITFDVNKIVTGEDLPNATCEVNGTTKNCADRWALKQGTYNVTASNPGYYNRTTTITINTTETTTKTLNPLGDIYVNIHLIDAHNQTKVNNFTAILKNATYNWNSSETTTNGNTSILALNNTNYTITVSADNYATTTVNRYVNKSEQNITIQRAGSVWIKFLDAETRQLVTPENITLELISSDATYQLSTTTGYIYKDVLPMQNYTARYRSNGYEESFRYFEINATNNVNETWLLINNGSSRIEVLILDETARPVEDAIVKALRYNIDTNTYDVQEMGKTNNEGKTYFHLTMDDEFYKFVVDYNDETVKITSPAYITSNSIVIQISTSDKPLKKFFEYLTIDSSIVFDTSIDSFKFTFNDVENIANKYCLKVYRKEPTGDVFLNESCLFDHAGTIYIPVTPINGTTYEGRAYYDDEYLISATYTYPESDYMGKSGLFMQVILTLAIILLSMTNVVLMPIAIPFSVLIGRLIHLNLLPYPAIIGLFVLGIIISFMLGKKH